MRLSLPEKGDHTKVILDGIVINIDDDTAKALIDSGYTGIREIKKTTQAPATQTEDEKQDDVSDENDSI